MTLTTLQYTPVVYLDNEKATASRNVVNAPSPIWEGIAEITPKSDFWFDETTRPNQNRDIGPAATFWEELGNILPYNADRDFWDFISGRPSPSSWREVGEAIDFEAEKTANQDTQIEVLVRPFMRARVINVHLTAMKANSRIWVFFDEEDITEHCYHSSGSLVTNDSGELDFQIFFPGGRFEVGTKIFEFVDSETLDPNEITTLATATYTVNGLSSQELDNGVISTQRPRIRQRSQRETPTSRNSNTVSHGLAYTFYVDQPGGMFVSQLGLFFKEKGDRRVNVQIRAVENGQPTNTVLPYAECILDPINISISNDSTAETTASFCSPVYLNENQEYAVVLNTEGNSDKFEYWTARLGDQDIITNERVTETIASGSVYEPADNKTWINFAQEDFKLKIYRAEFDTSVPFTVTFKSRDFDFLNIGATSEGDLKIGDKLIGDTWLRFGETGEAFVKGVGDTITFDSGTVVTVVQVDSLELYVELDDVTVKVEAGDTFTDTNSIEWTVAEVEEATGTVVARKNPVVTLDESTGRFLEDSRVRTEDLSIDRSIDEIVNISVNDLRPLIGEMVFEGTSLNWEADLYDGASFQTIPLDEGERREFTSPKTFMSRSNEVQALSGAKSVVVRATGSTEVNNLSPVIDEDRAGLQTYSYFLDDSLESQYFTNSISLDEDSEDLRLVFDAKIPSGAFIDVMYKAQNSSDDRDFADIEWALVETLGYNENNFDEYDLTVPESDKDVNGIITYSINGADFYGFNRFAIKFVLRATNSSRYPVVKKLRAIALEA